MKFVRLLDFIIVVVAVVVVRGRVYALDYPLAQRIEQGQVELSELVNRDAARCDPGQTIPCVPDRTICSSVFFDR